MDHKQSTKLLQRRSLSDGKQSASTKKTQSSKKKKKKDKKGKSEHIGKSSTSPEAECNSDNAAFDSDASASNDSATQKNAIVKSDPSLLQGVGLDISASHAEMTRRQLRKSDTNKTKPPTSKPSSNAQRLNHTVKGAPPASIFTVQPFNRARNSQAYGVPRSFLKSKSGSSISHSTDSTPTIREESLRWEFEIENEEEEEERMRVYKINRRKRYLAAANQNYSDWVLSCNSSTSIASSSSTSTSAVRIDRDKDSAKTQRKSSGTTLCHPPVKKDAFIQERIVPGLVHKPRATELMINC